MSKFHVQEWAETIVLNGRMNVDVWFKADEDEPSVCVRDSDDDNGDPEILLFLPLSVPLYRELQQVLGSKVKGPEATRFLDMGFGARPSKKKP